MKTTILGGILFLVPLTIIAIVLGKTFELSMLIAAPLDGVIPLDSVGGIAFANILAITMIVLICYIAGVVARGGLFANRVEKLDGVLIDIMPGYAVIKGMIGSVSESEDIAAVLKPVLVRFDDYEQVAFELERDETRSVLFLPGSPSAWSGSSVVVDVARVAPLSMPTHQTVKLMRVLGRGTLKLPELN